ncbi:transposase [Leucobacter aridicollis]|nr:transposase [Leucobacter aridicollis]
MSTKTHQLVVERGLPRVTICSAGQDGDTPILIPLLEHLRVGRRCRPDAVLGDQAYSSQVNRSHLRKRGIEAVIPEPREQTRPSPLRRLRPVSWRRRRPRPHLASETASPVVAGCAVSVVVGGLEPGAVPSPGRRGPKPRHARSPAGA